MDKNLLESLLSGGNTTSDPTDKTEKLVRKVDRGGGEIVFESEGNTVVESIQVPHSYEVVPAHTCEDDTTAPADSVTEGSGVNGDEEDGSASVELEWSRSMSYNKISLKVRLYQPAPKSNLDKVAEELVKRADKIIRNYAYGTGQKELEHWANER